MRKETLFSRFVYGTCVSILQTSQYRDVSIKTCEWSYHPLGLLVYMSRCVKYYELDIIAYNPLYMSRWVKYCGLDIRSFNL